MTDIDKIRCKTCGRDWEDHPGIMATCAENARLRKALEKIHSYYSHFDTMLVSEYKTMMIARAALERKETR